MSRLLVVALLGCGGAGDSGPGAAATGAWPRDTSESGIAAYLASGAYREAPWVAETDAPRDANSGVSPHGRVRVWFNDVLVDSQRAGNGEVGGTPHPEGAMSVKELYDDGDAVLGHAVMLKRDGAADDWLYTCDETPSRCGSSAAPVYGVGLDTDCGFCHGGVVFNAAP